MARFYFDFGDGASQEDESGIEFETVSAAKLEGAIALARIVSDSVGEPGTRPMFIIIIRDETRRAVARVSLSLAVEDINGDATTTG